MRLLRQTLVQCQATQDFWSAHDFQLRVGGIDITESERAAADARIKHLEDLIHGMERDAGEAAD
ncbi:hypothetical protein [Brevundimonas sp.]